MQHQEYHEGNPISDAQLPAKGQESQPGPGFKTGPLVAGQPLPDKVRPAPAAERMSVEDILGVDLQQREWTLGFPSPMSRIELLPWSCPATMAQAFEYMPDGIR
jgi:hypothetical protein